jgi:hypothetical protein
MSVSVSTPSVVAGGDFPVGYTLVNTGDEPAKDVSLSLLLPGGFEAERVAVGTLQPNSPVSGELMVHSFGSILPGTYPLAMRTSYSDANAYPFSTVSLMKLNFIKPSPERLSGNVSGIRLYGQTPKDLGIVVMNLDSRPHKVTVQLHMPNELTAASYSQEVDVGGNDAATVSVPVKSSSALPGSSYAVYASMEYDDQGIHYSGLASGTVDVPVEMEDPFWQKLPLAALIFLLLVFIYHQVKR